MKKREIGKLVESTADPAFAVNGLHNIEFWNRSAETFFGIEANDVIGKCCGSIMEGDDECGAFCSPQCSILKASSEHKPVQNFDLQMNTKKGKQWCNVSILIADEDNSVVPFTIHVVRPIDVRKRLESLLRDFVVNETAVEPDHAMSIISSTRSPSRETILTERELEILRLLAKGKTTSDVADALCISRTTVNNHTQHILKKFNAHSRLEAIRRAEHSGLI